MTVEQVNSIIRAGEILVGVRQQTRNTRAFQSMMLSGGQEMTAEKQAIIDRELSTDEGILRIAKAASSTCSDPVEKDRIEKHMVSLLKIRRGAMKTLGIE